MKSVLKWLKNLFKQEQDSDIIYSDIQKDIELIKKLREEIKSNDLKHLKRWEDLEPFCSFSYGEKKHILIVDDDKSAVDLVKRDIYTILSNNLLNRNINSTVKERISNLHVDSSKYEIRTIDDVFAPYRVIKTCDLSDPTLCNIDYAAIDIIFGEFVLKDGEKIYMDGIDLVKYLLDKNPNAKICLFTGCYLNNEFSIEKEKIIELLGEDFLKNNVIEKTPDTNYRISKLIDIMEFKDD